MGGGGQPIDSTRTDARGAYALTIRRPDSATIYVVSTWYAGIAYFSEPITPGRSSSSLRPLPVYDTSSTGPPVRVTRRLITVAREKRDGSRDVLELVRSEEHTSELQSRLHLVCRLLLEKKKKKNISMSDSTSLLYDVDADTSSA